MKIGIISDIHANLAALEAVLAALRSENCVKILCAGDVVGYGPSPKQCLALVRDNNIACVRGNHDDMMTNIARLKRLRPDVRSAIEWTRQQLGPDERTWLGQLPLSFSYGGVEIIHASHALHPEWQYVLDSRSMLANFLFQGAPISFNGHSHVPLLTLHVRGERPRMCHFQEAELSSQCRYLINVGSVGQPRDRNPMAAYATFETRERRVRLHRVAYDIADTQRKMIEAGLPEALIARLAAGR